MAKGKLYIVPTPIGNLKDITLRAIETLKKVDEVWAEDTRTSGRLMKHLEISVKLNAYHMHNEHSVVHLATKKLIEGKNLALISDAGTPGISDPGYLLIRESIQNQIEVECLPGATAFIPALVQSGIACNQFTFLGFLPQKKGRKTALEQLKNIEHTLVLYESPHRIEKLVQQLLDVLGNREFSYSREISKQFHETFRGTLEEAQDHIQNATKKGEYVVVIGKAL